MMKKRQSKIINSFIKKHPKTRALEMKNYQEGFAQCISQRDTKNRRRAAAAGVRCNK